MAVEIENSEKRSSKNSTNTALGAGETFTGQWEYNAYEHVAQNVVTDQDGTMYVDFAILKDGVNPLGPITDDDVTITLQSPAPVYANTPYFRPLVKVPCRAYRVRYVNGSVAQGSMALLSCFGNNLFPASSTTDSELLTTVTERERNVAVSYIRTLTTIGTEWACLIDKSDTTNWPHTRTGRVDISVVNINIDKTSNARGRVAFGVITRIDETDADVTLLQGDVFTNSSGTEIQIFRNYAPTQIKCAVEDGGTPFWLGNSVTNNVTAINTGVSLDSPNGTSSVTPAVGDIVMRYILTGGTSMTVITQLFYHGEF